MNPDQSGTRNAGPFSVKAGEDLTGKRSFLTLLGLAGGVAVATLPTSNVDLAIYQLCEEAANGEQVDVDPLVSGGANRRVWLKGVCNPGEVAVLADVATPADKGKVRKLPAAAGLYVQVGIFEEVGVDAQLVQIRPLVRILHVKSADTITGAADLAALKAALVPLLQAQGLVV